MPLRPNRSHPSRASGRRPDAEAAVPRLRRDLSDLFGTAGTEPGPALPLLAEPAAGIPGGAPAAGLPRYAVSAADRAGSPPAPHTAAARRQAPERTPGRLPAARWPAAVPPPAGPAGAAPDSGELAGWPPRAYTALRPDEAGGISGPGADFTDEAPAARPVTHAPAAGQPIEQAAARRRAAAPPPATQSAGATGPAAGLPGKRTLAERPSASAGTTGTAAGDSAAAALPPAWGWKIADGGRAAHVAAAGLEYQATTTQLCGLFPFVAGSGTPVAGTPVGRHQLWGEVVCLDPLAWLRAGLVTNPGMFILGQPGTGKSALVKRQVTGAVAAGTRPLILGDAKPDYTALISYLGGQVIRIGRGLDKINPLDAGPLGTALSQLTGAAAERLRQEVRSRRLALLMALATLIRETRLSNAEEVILGRAIDLLDERNSGNVQPTVTDVLNVIEQGPDTLRTAARAAAPHRYAARVADLVFTLDLLCTGSLAGVFDGHTSRPIDLDAPAVSVDISAVKAAGDKLLTAAMLCTWSYGFGCVDAASALAELGAGPRRSYLAVMDELWRALRGAPGLVEHADSLTRLNRAKGMASIMITHSLADLDALATEEDRARARGFMERSAITVLAGLPPRELARVNEITPLTGPEQALVASWSAPESYQPGARHHGRGKYLIKTGERLGIPVQLTLVGPEHHLYDTDPEFEPVSGRPGAGTGNDQPATGEPGPRARPSAGSASRSEQPGQHGSQARSRS